MPIVLFIYTIRFFKNLSVINSNSSFGSRLPKCASNGDFSMVFCLLHFRSLKIVLKLGLIDFVFSSSTITPSLRLVVCMDLSTKPHCLWSPTGQSFFSMFNSAQNRFTAFPLNPEI